MWCREVTLTPSFARWVRDDPDAVETPARRPSATDARHAQASGEDGHSRPVLPTVETRPRRSMAESRKRPRGGAAWCDRHLASPGTEATLTTQCGLVTSRRQSVIYIAAASENTAQFAPQRLPEQKRRCSWGILSTGGVEPFTRRPRDTHRRCTQPRKATWFQSCQNSSNRTGWPRLLVGQGTRPR